ncbi:MAG: 2-oxoacid:acceptor oxidoreductase subunit alpha [bacterium]
MKDVKTLEHVTIRFAGDSGDGMQLTGNQFTRSTALSHNDLSTFPDFPAEIRAPAGTVHGVSGFQIHFSSEPIYTPGDNIEVLVAMNPAALKVNLNGLADNATIIVNTDSFTPRNLKLAGFEDSPLEDGSLSGYHIIKVELSRLTQKALESVDLSHKEKERCKNFYALGIVYSLYHRDPQPTLDWITEKFAKNPVLAEANSTALIGGRNYASSTEMFTTTYKVPEAKIEPGVYRNITGNEALVLGMIAAGQKSGLNIFLASYPITPASEVLQMLSVHKNFGAKSLQAEDEISAIGMAIGASFAGDIGMTVTSGPGLALKSEFLGLAVTTELPVVVFNIQRAGPSTGMPTKTEQADLQQVMYGRSSESPVAVIAAGSPAGCFFAAYEAIRIAVQFMVPVLVLSDLYLAIGAEPWKIPDVDDLPEFTFDLADTNGKYRPYERNPETLARRWAIPGTPGLEHRIGGLEKEDITGNVSYDPENHDKMVRLRAEKIQRIGNYVDEPDIYGDASGDVLVVSWGSTRGVVLTAVEQLRKQGKKVSFYHLRWINPLPKSLGKYVKNFKRVLVPEINLGQLIHIVRSKYLVDAIGFNRVKGLPLHLDELKSKINELVEG